MPGDFLRLLSKQPSRRRGGGRHHFLSPNLLQKESSVNFMALKSTQKHIVQTNVFFQAKHVENATSLMPAPSLSADGALTAPRRGPAVRRGHSRDTRESCTRRAVAPVCT